MDNSESLGSYLKRERENRKISLKTVAKNTRVREEILRAIEEDRFDELPSPTYVRGFLLAYAKYIGLSSQDVLLHYESTLKRRGEPPVRQEAPSKGPSEAVESRGPIRTWSVVGGIIVLCILLAYVFYPWKSVTDRGSVETKSEEAKPSTPSASIPILPSSTQVETTPPAPAQIATTPRPLQEERRFSLQLKAVEETWVRIQVDDEPVQEMTFKPEQGSTFKASKRISLFVGNAGGLDLVLNGKPVERFGKSGEVVTLIATPEKVEMKQAEKKKPQE